MNGRIVHFVKPELRITLRVQEPPPTTAKGAHHKINSITSKAFVVVPAICCSIHQPPNDVVGGAC